jgi:hypothetical protein
MNDRSPAITVDNRKGRRPVIVSGTASKPTASDLVSAERLGEFTRAWMGLRLSAAPNICIHDERSFR